MANHQPRHEQIISFPQLGLLFKKALFKKYFGQIKFAMATYTRKHQKPTWRMKFAKQGGDGLAMF